jgi:NADH-ubiquinone oxidoreductase chain 6
VNVISNIYLISDTFNGFSFGFLDLITIVSIIAGIFIIVSKNPIVSVLYLILLFSAISCYLIFIGVKFIGISYLLVYVGAVSILFLFILMLINIRISELISDTNNNIPLAIFAIFTFFVPYSNLIPDNTNILESIRNIENISYVSSNN